MESDFKNCHMFLVTILNKAVCRGSFPHCKQNINYSVKFFCLGFSIKLLCTQWHNQNVMLWNVLCLSFLWAVESLALSLMAGFEQCWRTMHVSVVMWWTELHCLVLCPCAVCPLTAVIVHHDVRHMMSPSPLAVGDIWISCLRDPVKDDTSVSALPKNMFVIECFINCCHANCWNVYIREAQYILLN